MIVLYGLLYGVIISVCFSFGPAFFTLLQTSVERGYRDSYPIAFGINHNDIVVVTLLLTVFRKVDMITLLQTPLYSLIGAVVLCLYGLYTIRQKPQDAESQGQTLQQNSRWKVYLKGLTINTLNPMIWIFWASFISAPAMFGDKLSFSIDEHQLGLLFVGVLIATLSLDILKCKLASMLQRFFTAQHLRYFNIGIGIVLIGFGLWMVASSLLGR